MVGWCTVGWCTGEWRGEKGGREAEGNRRHARTVVPGERDNLLLLQDVSEIPERTVQVPGGKGEHVSGSGSGSRMVEGDARVRAEATFDRLGAAVTETGMIAVQGRGRVGVTCS